MDPSLADLPTGRPADHRTFKTCSCGRTFTRAEWLSLPFVGIGSFEFAEPPETDEEVHESRNCPCGSTLSVVIGSRGGVSALLFKMMSEHLLMQESLRAVQARCGELLEENRGLKRLASNAFYGKEASEPLRFYDRRSAYPKELVFPEGTVGAPRPEDRARFDEQALDRLGLKPGDPRITTFQAARRTIFGTLRELSERLKREGDPIVASGIEMATEEMLRYDNTHEKRIVEDWKDEVIESCAARLDEVAREYERRPEAVGISGHVDELAGVLRGMKSKTEADR